MKSSSSAYAHFAKTRCVVLLVGCLSGLFSPGIAFSQQADASEAQLAPASSPEAATRPPQAQSREAWRAELSRHPLPKKGCFNATYPSTEWHEVPCGPPSRHPNPPAKGPRSDTVGNGTDFVAQTSGLISTAVGSFNSVIDAKSVQGDVGGSAPQQSGVFMLQINTQFFSSPPACKGIQGCRGWQQFLFSQTQGPPPGPGQQSVVSGTTPVVFMEYWLLGYGQECPSTPPVAGGTSWMPDGDGDCWANGPTTYVPPQTVASLAGLVLTASTNAAAQDTVALETTNGEVVANGGDSVLALAKFWNAAEFNVFGDCCLTQTVFNNGSTIEVKTSIDDGTTNAPDCPSNGGTTGETNNLSIVSPCWTTGGTSPAIEFTEAFGSPPAVSMPFVDTYTEHDQQHYAYLTANGDIWDAYYCAPCSGAKWHTQKINDNGMTSGPPAASAPFVDVFTGHDQQHFVYLAQGRSGEIWDAYYCPGCSGNKWKLQKINLGSGGMTDAPSAVSAPFVDTYVEHDQQHFAYLANDGAIWDAYYCPGCSGNGWQKQQITCNTVNCNGAVDKQAPAALSGPFVSVFTGHDQQHFAYLGANGDIWDAYYCAPCSGNKWQAQKINDNGVTSGLPAASPAFINVYLGHDQQHFVYLAQGNAGQIVDAYYCPGCSGNKWKLQKINLGGGAVTTAPQAVAAPFVDTYQEHDQQHFAYLSNNGEIWDAFYCPGCGGNHWQKQQINCSNVSCAGAVDQQAQPAVSGPFVDVYSGHDQQHFAYLGQKGAIWDAYYCPGCSGNKWKFQQIVAPDP